MGITFALFLHKKVRFIPGDIQIMEDWELGEFKASKVMIIKNIRTFHKKSISLKKFLLKIFTHVDLLLTVKLRELEYMKSLRKIRILINVFTFGESFQGA